MVCIFWTRIKSPVIHSLFLDPPSAPEPEADILGSYKTMTTRLGYDDLEFFFPEIHVTLVPLFTPVTFVT
jgi:hypothetical protein